MNMIQTTPELAFSILENQNRKVITSKGDEVEWINPNNETLFAGGTLYNWEDTQLFICVPTNARTVY